MSPAQNAFLRPGRSRPSSFQTPVSSSACYRRLYFALGTARRSRAMKPVDGGSSTDLLLPPASCATTSNCAAAELSWAVPLPRAAAVRRLHGVPEIWNGQQDVQLAR